MRWDTFYYGRNSCWQPPLLPPQSPLDKRLNQHFCTSSFQKLHSLMEHIQKPQNPVMSYMSVFPKIRVLRLNSQWDGIKR